MIGFIAQLCISTYIHLHIATDISFGPLKPSLNDTFTIELNVLSKFEVDKIMAARDKLKAAGMYVA